MDCSVTLIAIFVIVLTAHTECRFALRRKRDGLMDQLAQALSQLTAPLIGTKQTVQNNDPMISQPSSLGILGRQGTLSKAVPAPSIIQSVGYCDDNEKQCDYLHCLATNFKNSNDASNVRQGTKAMSDPELRTAIANNPQISKIACERANLDEAGCSSFQQLLGLVNKLDPQSAHVNDEPRDKRSPDYYDHHGSGSGDKNGPNTLSGNKNGSKASSGSAPVSSVRDTRTKSSSTGPSSKVDYYDDIRAGSSIDEKRITKQDCNTILDGGDHKTNSPPTKNTKQRSST